METVSGCRLVVEDGRRVHRPSEQIAVLRRQPRQHLGNGLHEGNRLSDEELGAFFAAGGAEPYNGSDYLEAFQSVADVEIERPARAMYGELSAREATIENGMRVARALG